MRSNGKQPPDFWFFLVTVVLVVVGVLVVFDASFARAGDHKMDDAWYFVKRQIVYAGIRFLGLFAAMQIDPSRFRKWRIVKLAMPVAIFLLVLVMVPGIGKTINGSMRWIPIGPFHLQPSEVAKLAVVIYLADVLAANGLMIRRVGVLFKYLIPVGIVALLVLIEPDMGTAVAIVLTTAVMLFIAGVRKHHLLTMGALGAVAGIFLIIIEPYRMERWFVFLHPMRDYYGSGYQIIHSLIALSTGGLWGKGLCEGREKFFLPTPQTDMIGPTIAEEAGFIGMLILLALFVLFIYRGLCIGHRAKAAFTSLLAIGITSMVGLQALMNIAVFSASIPATGVPLPFISYGGSYLIVMLVGAGIVLSVSRNVDMEIPEPKSEKYESRYLGRRDRGSHISCTEYRPTAKRTRRRTPVHR